MVLRYLIPTLLCFCNLLAAQDGWKRELRSEARFRISRLVKQLDASPAYRQDAMDALLREARGPNQDIVLSQLSKAIAENSGQLRTGIVNVYASLAEPQTLPILIRQLRYDTQLDVRIQILQSLPVFILQDAQVRKEVDRFLNSETYAVTKRIREWLRSPPYRKGTSEFLPKLAHQRAMVEDACASQLDPVLAAIDGLASKRDEALANRALVAFTGQPLGTTQDDWITEWKTLRQDKQRFESLHSFQTLTTLHTLACSLLRDIGAEGSQEVCDGLLYLTRLETPRSLQEALRTAIALAEFWGERLGTHREKLKDLSRSEQLDNERAWLQRQITSARRLLQTTKQAGTLQINHPDPGIRKLALQALSFSYEPIHPLDTPAERDIKLNRAKQLVEDLHKYRVNNSGKISPNSLEAIAAGLAYVGTGSCVDELVLLAGYRSFQKNLQAERTEYRVVRAATEGLGKIGANVRLPARKSAQRALLGLLSQDRVLRAGPPRSTITGRTDRQPLRVRDLAEFHLMRIANTARSGLSADQWKARLEASD